MKFGFVAKYRDIWSVRWLCAALDVTCAGFYAWLKRPRSARACLDETLTTSIQRSFAESDRTYGARRVRRDLLDWGQRCGIHRVERLMRRSQLIAQRSADGGGCLSTSARGLSTRSHRTYWNVDSMPPR